MKTSRNGTEREGRPRPGPSGLLPSGPPRPTYRELHPVRALPVLAGMAAGGVWLIIFALLGQDLRARAWWTVTAGAAAWLAAALLARAGDRGAAAGIAAAVGVGLAAATATVTWRWYVTADWPLW